MIAKHIQANDDHLQETQKVFMRHADTTVALTVQVEGLLDQLQGGAWWVWVRRHSTRKWAI